MKNIFKSLEQVLKLFVPPVISYIWRTIRPRKVKAHLIYAPDGWDTQLGPNSEGWNSAPIIENMECEFENFADHCRQSGPLGFSHLGTEAKSGITLRIHNLNMIWAYVLALASRKKKTLSILDWGGGLGHLYLVAKSVIPEVTLDYHCKEMAATVATGRRINPSVTWYDNDDCLTKSFDLVLVSGSLQYMIDWRKALKNLAAATKNYALLMQTPIVDKGSGFMAIQRMGDTELLHQQFNKAEIIGQMNNCGFSLVREFVDGSRLKVVNTEIGCELQGWLFERIKTVNSNE